MPTINLRERKRKRVETRAKVHAQGIYQDPRWKSLRDAVIYVEPLCRRCREDLERVTMAEEVHHIIPFSQGRTPAQVELLAFDFDNCEPLCTDCHKVRHRDMRKL